MAGFYAEADETQKHIWHIERIWKLAESLEIIEIPIEDIEGLDSVTWFAKDGDQPTVRSMAKHAQRIFEADLSYPPILTARNRVFDGMHRIARHLMEGKTTLRVKRFAQDPEPDEIVHFANTPT